MSKDLVKSKNDIAFMRVKLDPVYFRSAVIDEMRLVGYTIRTRNCCVSLNGHLVVYGVDNFLRS